MKHRVSLTIQIDVDVETDVDDPTTIGSEALSEAVRKTFQINDEFTEFAIVDAEVV
jgi:hypothetical protein